MSKKLIFILIFAFLIFYSGYNYLRINKEIEIESSCLDDNKLDFENLEIGSTFNFNTNYKCKDWDEILILNGGSTFNRSFFILKTGIIIPKLDYINKLDSYYFLFFIKDGAVISNSFLFGDLNFTLAQHFGNKNYFLVKKEDAVFFYEKFDNPDYELYTFNFKMPEGINL